MTGNEAFCSHILDAGLILHFIYIYIYELPLSFMHLKDFLKITVNCK